MIAWNIREKILCTSTLLAGFAWFSSCLVRPNQIERETQTKRIFQPSQEDAMDIYFLCDVSWYGGWFHAPFTLFTVHSVLRDDGWGEEDDDDNDD